VTTFYIDQTATGANDGSPGNDAYQSIADIGVVPGGGGHIFEFAEGSGIYREAWDLQNSGVLGDPIVWNGHGVTVSGGLLLNNGSYKWTASITSGEWYLEAAAGGDPSLPITVDAATVEGYYMGESVESSRIFGSAGSLSYEKQIAWAATGTSPDSLAYDTVYIKLLTDPTLADIEINSLSNVVNTNWAYHEFHDFRVAFGSIGIEARGVDWKWYDCVFMHQADTGYFLNSSVEHELHRCVGFWAGHRLVVNSRTGAALRCYNCVDIESHLFLLIADNSTADSTTLIELVNCIKYGGEAGAIDKKVAASHLLEHNNCWYPRMTAPGGALGYVSTENWTITAYTDIPAEMATTESNQLNLLNPKFVGVDLNNFDGCDLHLKGDSPCLSAGKRYWTDAEDNPVDKEGHSFSDGAPDMGIYSTWDGVYRRLPSSARSAI